MGFSFTSLETTLKGKYHRDMEAVKNKKSKSKKPKTLKEAVRQCLYFVIKFTQVDSSEWVATNIFHIIHIIKGVRHRGLK